jgi:energy-coupling factor transport system substrate-specific component
MRDLIVMWGNTRMVVLTAMSASLYAAILIPFKVLPLIPGITEFRPANAIPVVCSFLFGPAGAWGAAIGNIIGDFFGGLGPGDLFGFFANLLYGFIPYKLWQACTDADPVPRSPLTWVAFVAVVALAAGACGLIVGWGLNLLGFIPFSILGNVVFFNNFAVAGVLSPLLLLALYPRVKRARLRYVDILPEAAPRRGRLRWLGVAIVIVAVPLGFLVGNLISAGSVSLPVLGAVAGGTGALHVGLGLVPIIALLVLGLSLL